MKDLKHLFLSTPDIGVNLSMLGRFIAGKGDGLVHVAMGLKPDNQQHVDCPYLMVSLRRIGTPGDPHFDDVYVMGYVLPAAIDDIRMADGSPSVHSKDSCMVIVVPHHCGEKFKVMRIRRKYIGKFISFQNNGHATKGGVYGQSMFGAEYVGIFRSMPEMYHALKSIYQDL